MNLRALLESDFVQHARTRIHALDAATLAEQLELAQIAAPPFGEGARGRRVRERFEELGLVGVHADEVGNVIGVLAAPTSAAPAAPVLVSAHLDTVFPAETELRVRHENGRVYVPGIADNARGLAALLTLARVLRELGFRPARPLVFVATVGEEGAGDLRGVKHLFREGSPWRGAHAFVSLDGTGLRRIVHRAVGSKRLRVELAGPGGHSWADWGTANPLHALGGAIAAIGAIELPRTPRTTLTVARAGGGTSINAIPEAAWMELDLRSEAAATLRAVEEQLRAAVAEAVRAENRHRRRGSPALRLGWQVIGDRPGGETPASSELVRAAVAATRALEVRPELAASSTDANVPMALGIPAVTLGAGGESDGIHTTEEWYANERGAAGVERALLVLLQLAS